MRTTILPLLFAGVMLPHLLFSQTDSRDVSNDTLSYTLEEFVVRDVRVRSLNNYSRLDVNTLNLQDQRHIFQSINTVPGVFMQSGAPNTNRITIRGIGNRSPFSTNKIKAYLDDIPLTDGIGETSVEDIELGILKKVDVWKGPTASRYGAGLGGMLHLQTNDFPDIGSFAAANFSIGSYNTLRYGGEVLYKTDNERSLFYFNANNTSSDGYRENNHYDRESIFLFSKSQTKSGDISVLFNYLNLLAFIPSSLNEEDFLNSPRSAAFTWGNSMGNEDYDKVIAGISFNQNMENNWKSILSANYFYFNSFELRPFNTLLVNSHAFSGRARFIKDALFMDNLSFEVGSEVYFQDFDWDVYETDGTVQGDLRNMNAENRSYQNLFSEFKYRFNDKIVSKIGLNYNWTHYKIKEDQANGIPNEPEYSNNILSPRFIVSFHPTSNTQFYINASHGFSPPTLEETLDANGSINRDIQPETGWNYELGGRGELFRSKLKYEIALYRMEIKNLLVARRTDFDQFIGVNAGQTRHQGLEIDLSYTFLSTCCRNYELKFIYSYSDFNFIDFVDGDEDYSGNDLTGTAPHIFNGLFKFQQDNFYGNLHYQFVDALPLRDDNSIYSESYQLLNAKIGYKRMFNNNLEIDVFAGLANIFDEHYASMFQINASSFGGAPPRYYYPGLPRNYYTGIKCKYIF